VGFFEGRTNSEVADQPALAAQFDMALAGRRSPSFSKFRREVEKLLRVLDGTDNRWADPAD